MPDLCGLRREIPAPASLPQVVKARVRERSQFDDVKGEVVRLRHRLEILEERCAAHSLEIHTLAPESYRLKKPIPVLVRSHDDEFLASFMDANINISGETEAEAFSGIKTLIIDIWESLGELSLTAPLGKELAARLAILGEYIDGSA